MNEGSPFNYDDVWFFDDLTGEYLKQAKEGGCEQGRAYYGEPDPGNEIPVCPFCDVLVFDPAKDWEHSRCKHLVFVSDMNTGVEYIHPSFANVFWKELYPRHKQQFDNSFYAEDLAAMQDARAIPCPSGLEFLECLEWWSIGSHFGDRGVDCCFVSDAFLKEHSLEPESEGNATEHTS